jgi:hypothetical protein
MNLWLSRLQFLILFVVLMAALLTACSSGGSQDAAAAVEGYIQAQVDKDLNQMVSLSCGTWEEGARREYESLAALTVTLDGMDCQAVSQTDQSASVTCNGKMVFNYGTEVLEVALADRVYQAVLEGGEWRVCGYQE